MRNHFHSFRGRRESAAFTLVEVLVVIAIVAVLTTFATMGVKKSMGRAQASKRLSNIRQAGTLLLAKANESNGRCSYFAGGNGNYEFFAHNIVRAEMGLTEPASKQPCEIMFWDLSKLAPNPTLEHWNCRAVNFKDVTYPDGTQTVWNQIAILDSQGRSGNVKSLSLSSVARPSSYPLLIDSSNSSGAEIFRINEGGNECVGLRESGKASAFMFDGSGRLMDKADLKKAGFTKAYDNSDHKNKTPKLITL